MEVKQLDWDVDGGAGREESGNEEQRADSLRRYTIGAAGEIELDCSTYQLTRAGVSLPIEPKAFDVLRYLIEHRDRVVPSQELFAKFWPPHISASVLSHYIVVARKVLGDHAERQRIIKTVRGRGYRFIGDVVEHLGQPARESVTAAPITALAPRVPTPWLRSDIRVQASEDPFVGRAGCMATLNAALEGVGRGQARLALITGEAGIGKTRVLSELSEMARARGMAVLSCRCMDDEVTPVFRPWTQLLRAALRTGVDLESELLRDAAAELGTFLPELRRRFERAHDPKEHEELARVRMFDAVAALLREVSVRQPLVIVIDDLHAADASSQALLKFVANQMQDSRTLIACSYREQAVRRDSVLAGVIGAIAYNPDCDRIELDKLSREDVAALIGAIAADRWSEQVVARVYELSAGNPFFAQELARWIAKSEAPDVALEQSAMPLPRSIRDAIDQRMASVGPEIREALHVLAAFGQSIHVSMLAEVLNVSRDGALVRADEAVRLSLAREAGAGSGCYEVVNTLVRVALEDSMSAMQRARLHGSIAEVLERNPRADRFDAIAYHLRKAAPAGDAHVAYKAVQASLRSADRAFLARAYEKCANECEQALALLELDVMNGVSELEGERGVDFACEVALRLGRANAVAGHRQAARKAFGRAADLARGVKRADLLGMAAIGLAGRYSWGIVDDTGARAALEEARAALVDEQHAELRIEVLGCLAGMLTNAARHQVSAEAMALTDRVADLTKRVPALVARHHALRGPDYIAERHQLAQELQNIAEQSGDTEAAAWSSYLAYVDGLSAGDVDGAKRNVDRFEALVTQLDRPVDMWLLSWARGCRALTFMHSREAERAIDSAAADGDRMEHPSAHSMRISHRVSVAMQNGRYEELDRLLGPVAATNPWVSRHLRAMTAFAHMERGDLDAARTGLDGLCSTLDAIPRDEHWLPTVFYLGAAIAGLPASKMADQLYAVLLPFSGRLAVDEATMVCSGVVDTVLAGLATTLQRREEATAFAERALAVSARLPNRVHLAIAELQYARTLLSRETADGRSRARQLAGQAIEHAVSAGSSYWAERARPILVAA